MMTKGIEQSYNCTTRETKRLEVELPTITQELPQETLEEKIDKRLREKGLIA